MDQSILGWLLIGVVAGVLGKALMPGKDPGGFVVTILIGIAGALLAGVVARSLNVALDAWQEYAAATAGAIVMLALYRLVVARRLR